MTRTDIQTTLSADGL